MIVWSTRPSPDMERRNACPGALRRHTHTHMHASTRTASRVWRLQEGLRGYLCVSSFAGCSLLPGVTATVLGLHGTLSHMAQRTPGHGRQRCSERWRDARASGRATERCESRESLSRAREGAGCSIVAVAARRRGVRFGQVRSSQQFVMERASERVHEPERAERRRKAEHAAKRLGARESDMMLAGSRRIAMTACFDLCIFGRTATATTAVRGSRPVRCCAPVAAGASGGARGPQALQNSQSAGPNARAIRACVLPLSLLPLLANQHLSASIMACWLLACHFRITTTVAPRCSHRRSALERSREPCLAPKPSQAKSPCPRSRSSMRV